MQKLTRRGFTALGGSVIMAQTLIGNWPMFSQATAGADTADAGSGGAGDAVVGAAADCAAGALADE